MIKAKSVTSGMVGMLRLLPFGRTYTGASGNQIDSDVPPDTSLPVGMERCIHANPPGTSEVFRAGRESKAGVTP